jgi:myo-inositol 2-dehydrogenase/D-chiro-inositol 1-dehydrogenase
MTKFALLGCGRIGKMHAATISSAPGAELVAVYDPVTDAADAVGRSFGCKVAKDAAEAIEMADAVLIATSTPTHADLIEAAANAGKAVFCEKPIDLDLKRVVACRKAVSGLGVTIQIGFNRRFDPGHRALRDAVQRGELGELQQVVITSRDPHIAPRAYLQVSGGIFRDMMIHDFDLARFVLGEEPTAVFATGSALIERDLETELGDVDSAMVIMRTDSGKLVHINNSRAASYGYDQRLEAFGSKAMLISSNRSPNELRKFDGQFTDAGVPYYDFFPSRYAEAFSNGIISFIESIKNGSKPDSTFDDGEKALVLADAAVLSKKLGRFVKTSEITGAVS